MKKVTLHWTLHPDKDYEWYKAQKKRRSEDWIARELDINYSLSVSGRVFSSFRSNRHIITERPEINPHRPIWRIWDFGKINCVLYAQKDTYGRTVFLHERLLGTGEHPSTTAEQIRVAIQDSKELFENASFYDVCDPAGSWEDHRGESPDVAKLGDVDIYPSYRLIAELPTRERKVRGRKLIDNDLQDTPNGHEALTIYVDKDGVQGCPVLKTAFLGGYCYRKDTNGNVTDKILERHPYEDVIDCVIYYYLESDGGYETADMESDIVYSDDFVNPYTGF